MKTPSPLRGLRALVPVLLLLVVPAAVRADNLFVSDYGNHTVVKIDSSGVGTVFISSITNPAGLAFDSLGNLYVANANSNLIEKFSSTGTDLGVFASTGMNNPAAMVFDGSGNLYVANRAINTVEKFSSAGTDLGVFADASDGLSIPTGLAFDASGKLYVSTTGSGPSIHVFTGAHTGSLYASTSDGLSQPVGMAFDSSGNLYVANNNSPGNTIEKFTAPHTGATFASTGLTLPWGLAFDSAGNLYASNEATFTVEKFNSAGVDQGVYADGGDGLNHPLFIAFASVPEPSTWALLAGGFGSLIAFRRRRRQTPTLHGAAGARANS